MAKNLVNQYVWLVDTIYKARKITYEQICQKWLDQGRGDKRIPLRTFHNWKAAAEEMFNLSIGCECKGGFYYYYIANREEIQRGDIRSWLLNTLSVSNLLADNITIKDRILLEDVPSREEFLSVILEAMKANTKLELTYRSYSRDESNTFEVHPYCVKLFKQRWYFVGFCPYYNKVMIYALDRIIFIKRMDDEPFEMPNPDVFSAEEFFEDYYGIIAGNETPIENVKIKVSAGQANYLNSLPLHNSQREIEKETEYSIFLYHLRPEYDFQQELLSMGPDVEVLSPKWLRDEISDKVKLMWNKYKKK